MSLSYFSHLVGNEKVKAYLARMISEKRIGHSLLFAGPDGIGKGEFALALASYLMHGKSSQANKKVKEDHPDLHLYRPEGKLGLHSIQTMRQFADEVHLPPYEAEWKVFIIHEADRMLSYSANALLKTFEEPPTRTLIILLTSSPSAILPTILSRCRTLYFQSLTEQEIKDFLREKRGLEDSQSQVIAQLAQGSIARALHLIEKGQDLNRTALFEILSQSSFDTYKSLSHACQRLVDQIEATKKQVEDTVKQEWHKAWNEQLSAQQHHYLEKELEGMVAMASVAEVHSLLEHLVSWYRDLHLLKIGGDPSYLINKDYHGLLTYLGQRGHLPDLSLVCQLVDDMRLAIQRSTSLQICFETLFLKLNFL